MNGVTISDAPAAGAPTTPPAIELIWMTQVLKLRPGGAGLADISLKSSRPLVPGCSSPTTYVSPRPLVMHASASSASGATSPPWQAAMTVIPDERAKRRMGLLRERRGQVTRVRPGQENGSVTLPNR